jgi:hypothetical protein
MCLSLSVYLSVQCCIFHVRSSVRPISLSVRPMLRLPCQVIHRHGPRSLFLLRGTCKGKCMSIPSACQSVHPMLLSDAARARQAFTSEMRILSMAVKQEPDFLFCMPNRTMRILLVSIMFGCGGKVRGPSIHCHFAWLGFWVLRLGFETLNPKRFGVEELARARILSLHCRFAMPRNCGVWRRRSWQNVITSWTPSLTRTPACAQSTAAGGIARSPQRSTAVCVRRSLGIGGSIHPSVTLSSLIYLSVHPSVRPMCRLHEVLFLRRPAARQFRTDCGSLLGCLRNHDCMTRL